jgi:Domain of unknown function DUF29
MTTGRAERLYEDDFYAWTQAQARELRRFARSRPNLPLDLGHIAEEIAELGTERCSAVRSSAARVIEHLLLIEHSPAQEPRRGWINEIVTLRRDIDRRLTPVLRRDLKRHLQARYEEARSDLGRKLMLYSEGDIATRFPDHCPYTLDQVLGDFWPASERGGEASS